jgi:hypothetical protein
MGRGDLWFYMALVLFAVIVVIAVGEFTRPHILFGR